jgi:CSLREA domain-containing protein
LSSSLSVLTVMSAAGAEPDAVRCATDRAGIACRIAIWRPRTAARRRHRVDINAGMNGRINVANTAIPGADIVVNTVSDELNADGDCSLREAITSANCTIAANSAAQGGGIATDSRVR